MSTGLRLRAPELVGDAWLGTGGRWVTLADLRGRFVLLDFWTLCCVNCHHVLAELRELEAQFGEVLTVIGVHSPKFDHERSFAAVQAAMARHGIAHPVLNDPDLHTWQAYAVRAWPTLVLIDPEGRIVATYSGEGHGHAIAATLHREILLADARGILQPTTDPYLPDAVEPTPYNQPSKVLPLDAGRLLVSDTGNHRLVLASIDDANDALAVVGRATRGNRDGDATSAAFNEPMGMALLPVDVAARVGYDVVIADSANHCLRGLRLSDLTVRTVAGSGAQWMQGDPTSGDALGTPLSTPWDLAWADDALLIAMAGEHRLWRFDPTAHVVEVSAGTSNEGLLDGPRESAWFAQPSALAADGDNVWVLDAETSALRSFDGERVTTMIGKGLFDFGHVDGHQSQALLQHPLGAVVASDGQVLIADTYNGAIRRYEPQTQRITTVVQGLREPTDLMLVEEGAAALVVESAAGRLTRVPLASGTRVSGVAKTTSRPTTTLRPGRVELIVDFTPPPGQKRDERYGPATQLVVTSTPPELIREGEGRGVELHRALVLDPRVGDGVLHVAARGASCDDAAETEHATCHIHQQDWGIPVTLDPEGSPRLVLPLAGG